MKKRQFIKGILIFIFLSIANFAFVLEARAGVSIKTVYFDDGYGLKGVSETSLSNIVDITVYTSSTADVVTVNGREADETGGGWDVYNVELKPGKNNIQVTATDEGSKNDSKVSKKYEINYIGGNVPGLNYVITDLTEAGKRLKLFDGALQVSMPKQNAVMINGRVSSNQRVRFSVADPAFKPTTDSNYISNIFNFTADYSNNCTVNGEAELTFEYDSLVSGTDSFLLTVLRLEPSYISNGFSFPLVQNLGGIVDTNANTITVKIKNEVFGAYVVVKKTGDFKDFYPQGGKKPSVAWSRPYVLALWAKGIMEPLDRYSNGSQVKQGYFGLIDNSNAETSITRGEMASLLVKALHLPSTFGDAVVMPTFSDISKMNLLERIPIETATRNGLFSGFPGNNGSMEFRPDATLTREQAAIILARATGAELPDPTKAVAYCKAYFKNDYDSINEWACPYILSAMQQGLFQAAEPGYMRPAKHFSRAEAARSVYLLMKQQGNI